MLKAITLFHSQSFKIKTFKSTHIPTLAFEPCKNGPPTSTHSYLWQSGISVPTRVGASHTVVFITFPQHGDVADGTVMMV